MATSLILPPSFDEQFAAQEMRGGVVPNSGSHHVGPEAFGDLHRAAFFNDDTSGTDFFFEALTDSMRATPNRKGEPSPQDAIKEFRSWVAIAIERLADGMAQVPLRSFFTAASGADPKEIIDPKHDLVRLFNKPNPIDTRFDFWHRTIDDLELVGNAVWLKVRLGDQAKPMTTLGKVVELWPLPACMMRPVFKKGQLYGYAMKNGLGDEVIIPPWDIVHHQIVDPANRFWGKGRIVRMIDHIRSSNAIMASQLVAFNNDIMASMIFKTKERLGGAQWKRLMSSIMSRYAGYTRAGKPLLLEQGLDAAPGGFAPKEMAYKDSSEIARLAIIAGFGVPPIIVGITDGANYSNTASQEHVFEKYSIKPRCIRIQERINASLVEVDFDADQLYVAFDDPVSEDAIERSKLEGMDLNNGVRYVDELRAERNLPPVEWGYGPRWWVELQEKRKMLAEFGAAAAGADAGNQNGDPTNSDGANPDGGNDSRPDSSNARPNDQGGDGSSGDATGGSRSSVVRAKGPSFGSNAGRRLPSRSLGRTHRPLPTPANRFANPATVSRIITRVDDRTKKLIRSIGKATARDYDTLKEDVVPTLRKFFRKQKERVIENVKRRWEGRVPDVARSASKVERQVFCVTAQGLVYARLFPDGSTFTELGNDEGVGRLGDWANVPGCRYRDGEWTRLQIRKIDDADEEELDDWRAAADKLAEAMLPKMKKSMSSGGNAQSDYLDFSDPFNLDSPRAREWLNGKQRDYWNSTVNATTKKLLSESLSAELEAGTSLDKLIEVVERVMDGRIQSSAETIARTEVVGAYNAGSSIVRKECGVEQKQWVATYDDRTRDAHADADMQTVPESAKFSVDGEELEYPGDPNGSVSNIVNCRCTAIAIIE